VTQAARQERRPALVSRARTRGEEGLDRGEILPVDADDPADAAQHPRQRRAPARPAERPTEPTAETAAALAGRATAALEDRLHAFEQAAVVRLPDGETIPFQRVAVLIANEPRRERRLALDLARRAVLDEPTAAMDAATARAVMGAVMAQRAGRTTVVVTHQAELLGIPKDYYRTYREKIAKLTPDQAMYHCKTNGR